jgi:DNA repair helicase RAD25
VRGFLEYQKGTLASNLPIPNGHWDERSNCYRAKALYYRDIVEYLKESDIEFEDEVFNLPPMEFFEISQMKLRDYQQEALDKWMRDKKGVLILPTGAGKTNIGIKAIEMARVQTLVVVPTIELISQWKRKIKDILGVDAGEFYGENHEIKGITISTYDSAYLRAEELGNRFLLVMFDEVHHLPSPSYSMIAEMFASPFRMGLTATYEREDMLHGELDRLIGGKIYEVKLEKLKGKHLADYEVKRIRIDLTDEESVEYDKNYSFYTNFLRKHNIRMGRDSFKRFIFVASRGEDGRKAILSRNRAREIAMNSEAKIEALRKIIEEHREDRMIIFTELNSLVYRISKEFLMPAITYQTPPKEREELMNFFRKGDYERIVTSKVLEEGIDVPEASVGVIVSGSGSVRQYRQRLGRILRKKENKKAMLYEIVSNKTLELGSVRKRHRRG